MNIPSYLYFIEINCQLCSSGALEATDMSTFGTGNGNFLLDEVSCRGDESSLEDCSHNGWREHDCKSYEAAGVVCQVGRKGKAIELQYMFNCIYHIHIFLGDYIVQIPIN